MDEHERRSGHIEVEDKVDKLCNHIDKYIVEERNFHKRVERMFVDYFGDLDPVEHKQHHTWARTLMAEQKARADFLSKIKFEVIKNAVLIGLGAIAMYVAVSVYQSVAKDVAKSAAPQQYEQTK